MTEPNHAYPLGPHPETFEDWCDQKFPQWRFSLHAETVDAVRWMREAFAAGLRAGRQKSGYVAVDNEVSK